MKILIACEESQEVCKAFRELGHDAYSCDTLSCSGGHPEWHIMNDVLNILGKNLWNQNKGWDLMIAHPPCTYLAVSGARWFKNRIDKQEKALWFVMQLMNAPIKQICIENPISVISTRIQKPDQIIQPWMFGHGEIKATCLWLKNLPELKSTNIVKGREARIHKMPPSKDRSKLRSRTYPGIAKAMAEQWGNVSY